MPYANNRAALKPRFNAMLAGGVILKFRHPMLSYQIDETSPIDEIDVSRSVKLNETFFNATPAQDSSFQEVLVDGSVIAVTNHLMAGTLTLPVVRTSGLVGDGDFVAAAHLIIASKDSEGGVFTVIQDIGGKRIITLYYGCTFKNVPHQVIAGNAVVTYPMVINYAGWIQANGKFENTKKVIWAVGNRFGIEGVYKPFDIQAGEQGINFYSGNPLSDNIGGVTMGTGDSGDNDIPTSAHELDTGDADGMVEATRERFEGVFDVPDIAPPSDPGDGADG